MATVLISAFYSALHSNNSSLAKVILLFELTKLRTPNVWNVYTMSLPERVHKESYSQNALAQNPVIRNP